MPEMDGFALAEQIQKDPEAVNATIMMLTHHRDDRSCAAGRSGEVPCVRHGWLRLETHPDERSLRYYRKDFGWACGAGNRGCPLEGTHQKKRFAAIFLCVTRSGGF
jgi:hypothetical protein